MEERSDRLAGTLVCRARRTFWAARGQRGMEARRVENGVAVHTVRQPGPEESPLACGEVVRLTLQTEHCGQLFGH